ncbi:MAG: respiratory nitrate reductase subunit gamma, partial [Nitriliruptorales bacterium]|nr:respiratory nitrate reductase subunit gamma [Nitriliruptorales bacterium]
GVFAPYIRSLLTLDPRVDLVADLPFVLQLHAFTFFVFLGVFPFSRLVHIITIPLGYLVRPWQVVVGLRGREGARGEAPVISWPAALGRSTLIVIFFVLGTVWLPSFVMRMDALSTAPSLVRDLLAAGIWLALVVAGLWGLRWAQRSARI